MTNRRQKIWWYVYWEPLRERPSIDSQRADGVCRYCALRLTTSALYKWRPQKHRGLQTFQHRALQCRCSQKAQKNIIICQIKKITQFWCYIYFEVWVLGVGIFSTLIKRFIVAERNIMKFKKGKCKVLHLGRSYSLKTYGLGTDWLGSSSAGKDLRGPDETWAKRDPAVCPGSNDHFPQSSDLLIQPDSS